MIYFLFTNIFSSFALIFIGFVLSKSPSNISSANLSSSIVWIVRLSGLAPYASSNPSFADIQGEWFQSGIEFMHHKGAFNVEEGGNVQPYLAITRGETFKIVALGLGFTTDTTLSNAEYTNLLYELGYIVGDGSGNLNVGGTITRAEFCTMYNRIIGHEYALLVDAEGNEITAETYGFTDLDSGKWYYEAMLRATSAYDDDGYVDIAKRGIRNNLDDYGN